MPVILGKDFKLYLDEAGAADGQGTPANWLEADNVKDLTLSLEKATDDVSTRGGGDFRAVVATLSDGTTDFQLVYDTTDPTFITIEKAFFGSGTLKRLSTSPHVVFSSPKLIKSSCAGTTVDACCTNSEVSTSRAILRPNSSINFTCNILVIKENCGGTIR